MTVEQMEWYIVANGGEYRYTTVDGVIVSQEYIPPNG